MNKGFISMIFLVGFLNIFTLITTMLSEFQTQLKILDSMKQVNQEINLEALLIDEVNCKLANDEKVEENFEIGGVNVTLYVDGTTILVEGLNKDADIELIVDTENKRIFEVNH